MMKQLLFKVSISAIFPLMLTSTLTFATNYTVNIATDSNPTGGGSGSGTTGDLRYVLTQLNSTSSANKGTAGAAVTNNNIAISSGIGIINLAADLPVIRNGVTISAVDANQQINGQDLYRLFATSVSSLSLNNLVLNRGLAKGGNGAPGDGTANGTGGGGGGLGAGGGVYIDLGQTLTITNTRITSCNAAGGAGGAASGGSMAGQAGSASFAVGIAENNPSGGYGGGNGGNGGVLAGNSPGGLATQNAGAGSPGKGASPTTSPDGGAGGYFGGGGGGGYGSVGSARFGGGGGGGGSTGGAGGPGGGGSGPGAAGGGYGAGGRAPGGYGGGGGGGGFGGGGGSGNNYLEGRGSGGGGGGFGGGGGGGGDGSSNNGGFGGSYGGRGNGNTRINNTGGGGGGLGGGIFVGDSAALVFAVNNDPNQIVIDSNTVTPGVGAGSALNGIGYAPDIFLLQKASILFNGTGNLNVPFAIQADIPNSYPGNPGAPTDHLDSGINVALNDVFSNVTLSSTNNNYQGDTKITTGVLTVNSTNLPSTSAINIATNGTLNLTNAYAPSVAVTNAGKLNISGGAFTVPTSFTNTNGALYVVNGGSITGNITTGSSLNVGKDYTGAISAKSLTRVDNTTTVTSTNIYNGSTLTTSGTSTVNSNIYLLGTGNFSGSGFSGGVLTTGIDSFGNIDNTTAYAANQAISTYPTIAVAAGTFTNNGFAITGVSTAFTIANGATANLNANFAGTATAATSSNSGTLNLNTSSTFALSGFTNNSNGLITFNGVTNNTPITNNGTLTITGVSSNAAMITNNSIMNVNAGLTTNSGNNIANSSSGTLNLNSGGSIGTTGSISNAGNFNIGNAFSTTNFTNVGALYVIDNGSISGSLAGGTLLHIGSDSSGNISPKNFTTGGTIGGIPIIRVFNGSSFTAANAVSGVSNNFTVDAGASATFNAALGGTGGAFNNSGTTTIGSAGSINTTGVFTSSGALNILGVFTPAIYANTNITGGIYLIGTGNISGALTGNAGSSLNIGQDSIGAVNANDFISSGAISIPTVNVYANSSLTTSGANAISNVSDGMTIAASGTVNLGASFNGSGPVINNGTLTIGASYTAGLTTNNESMFLDGATINSPILNNNTFQITGDSVNNSTITNNTSITLNNNLSGSGTIANAATGTLTLATNTVNANAIANAAGGSVNITGNNVSNNGAISNSGTFTLTGSLAGAGVVTNNSDGTLIFSGGNSSNANSIINNGTFNINDAATNTGVITNNAAITLNNTLAGNGTIANAATGTLTLATNTANANTIANATGGSVNITGNNVSNSGAISNSGTLTLIGNLAGTGVVTNNSDGTLAFIGGNSTNASSIINNGTFNINDTATNNGDITNNANMSINVVLNGTGILNNDSGGLLDLNVGAVVSNVINNNAGSTLRANGGSSYTIYNLGTFDILQQLNATGNITNNGLVNMQNAINMPGSIFTNSGTTIISGTQTLTATNFVSDGALGFSIISPTTYDSLAVNGPIDLTNGTINITSTYFGPEGSSINWTILTGSSIVSTGTTVNTPITAFGSWTHSFTGNALRINYLRRGPGSQFTPLPGVDTEIAQVLDEMANFITNSGQLELVMAVDSANTQDEYNYILSNLQPDTNGSNVNFMMQSMGFNKIEVRVANRNCAKKNSSNNQQPSGFASGDLSPNTSMWIAGLGSISKQKTKEDNQGYRARVLGGMLGIDVRADNDDVYGVALGVSNANVYAMINTTNKLRVLGYNLMLYGANHLSKDCFAEWIVSGVINKNYGIRIFGINGIDLSTQASYRGALAGAKVNVGKKRQLNNILDLSQVNTAQYVWVHQPSYNETGSVAALHVSTKNNSSIFTLGTGIRLGILNDAPWLVGNRELHAMFTYDVITPQQATTANFIVGSNTFDMNSNPKRFAGKLGADCAFTVNQNLDLQFSYDYEVRSGYYNNFGEIKLRYVF